MGGAVSSGRDNNELIDNLMGGNYIRSRSVERVFRALDRADYMTPESRDQAYKDLAWRNGPLHMSSPCIYSEVMEGLELRPGLSFLNVGSGTGYLSTLAGLILGCNGISHGIEYHSSVVEYANKKLSLFIANSPTLDEFDFCEPRFFVGNGLSLMPTQQAYDRVYCGAGCPDEYENYFKQLIKVGGVLVMPLKDTLLQVRRLARDQWVSRSLLTVSFATLRVPHKDDAQNYVRLEEHTPPRLQVLARGSVRAAMRRGVMRRHPELRAPAARRQPPAACPRRICIPIEPGGAVDGLNIVHDLDNESGANEMNALLSLVIRMDQNRLAGAIRFDRVDSSSDSSSNSDDSSDDNEPRPDAPGDSERAQPRATLPKKEPSDADRSDESYSSLSSKSDASKSASTSSYNTRSSSSKETKSRKSDSNNSNPSKSTREKNGRKSDRKSSGGGGSTKEKKGRRGPDDDKSNKPERLRRVGSSGGLLAFEFQATERPVQPSTSSGAGRSSDTSTATSESGRANKKKSIKFRPDMCDCNTGDEDVIPAEVELCFRGGKVGLLPSTSQGDMDWEESKTETEDVKESSDEDEQTESTSNSKAKRQKLDSGIGENTPSGSSPDKSKTGETDTDERPSDSVTDEAELAASRSAGRRRVHKRSRGAASGAASTSTAGGRAGGAAAGDGAGGAAGGASASSSSAEEGGGRRRAARRVRGRGYDARRVRLSILMKRAIKELPLPYALKKYVNYGRCFEF
ncbi:uncharacterized protein [Epargyreus clarus]|uniref:uncharacterized protein n=1 Tax=Epargyreus clarus TaxID=520877 RepID=UPI003C2F5AA1